MLTLFTTPVIYLYFDRLAVRLAGRRPANPLRRRRAGRMNISAPFIARPVATTLLTIGDRACRAASRSCKLPVSPLPQVDFPTISVQAQLPGASPETVATSVASPLERHLGQIADVTEMTSPSSIGQARIVLQFDLNRDIDGAARDVQAAINAARADLPTNLRSNPTYRKVNPADAPILILALTSKTLTRGQMYDAASNVLRSGCRRSRASARSSSAARPCPRCASSSTRRRCSNTASGSRTCAPRLPRPTPTARRARSRTASGTSSSTPTTRRPQAADYTPLVIAYRNGAAVRLTDVADVQDSVEDVRNAGLSNGKPAVLVILFRQPGANIIETVDSVKAALPHLHGGHAERHRICWSPSTARTTIRAIAARHRTDAADRGRAGHAWWCSCSCAMSAPP